MNQMVEQLRRFIAGTAAGLFAHVDDPMASTLDYMGDPGLIGPGSISWELLSDAATFVGGIRALIIQGTHPEVVAGVTDHSGFRTDPLGRLSRTAAYVTGVSYGAMPEVEASFQEVRRAHRPVKGASHRGVNYTAGMAGLGAWVHNSLTDSFVVANQAFGKRKLSEAEADQFVQEQALIGAQLRADPLPQTAHELHLWVANHPDLAPSPGLDEILRFLERPPLDLGPRLGYYLLADAAVSTLPPRLRDMIDITRKPAPLAVSRKAVDTLRWLLGPSPHWRMAMLRTNTPFDESMFKQKLPFENVRS
jgi:uncharacterized protein (DUF2236 family)